VHRHNPQYQRSRRIQTPSANLSAYKMPYRDLLAGSGRVLPTEYSCINRKRT
jgi:hypothetical protein